MTNLWFAGNFCPREANCSLENQALTPSNGPKIRTLDFTKPPSETLPATIRIFTDEQSFLKAGTRPEEWAKCEGQLLSIIQYQSLFSLLGTMYGGDGRTSFGLPNLSDSSKDKGDYHINTSEYVGFGH